MIEMMDGMFIAADKNFDCTISAHETSLPCFSIIYHATDKYD